MEFTAIILAAGKGTRMKSALPKPLHRVGGHPMLGWSIDAARAAGATCTVAVLAPGSDEIETWLDDTTIAIQEEQLGTGNAVAAARGAVGMEDGIAMVMFADTPLVRADSISALVSKVADGAAIAVAAFEPADPAGYGRLLQAEDGSVHSIVEQRDATDAQQKIGLCNGGIIAVRTPLLFELLDQVTNDNAKGEYYLTDIVAIARADGAAILGQARDIAEAYGVVDGDWNGFNVLHTAASRVAGLDLGLTPGRGGLDTAAIYKAAETGKLDIVWLQAADEIDAARLEKAFVIYQGHHGDAGAHVADVILPGAAYTEKDGIYLNTEGRVQYAARAAFPPGEAREDWTIIRALAGRLGINLGFDTLAELREAMFELVPHFADADDVKGARWAKFGSRAKLTSAPIS
ncbi:MAG: molybdopterin-dependent oxidoreductase, partial [Pseudomonadota bacterium]|nr:molybdopterin-dependent oxidoreductase [Pseudomonadota bacterium]